jgi:hypothetical protein
MKHRVKDLIGERIRKGFTTQCVAIHIKQHSSIPQVIEKPSNGLNVTKNIFYRNIDIVEMWYKDL